VQENKRAQGSTDMSYQIRVEGHLDLSWQDWFEGLELRQEDSGTTLLVGVTLYLSVEKEQDTNTRRKII
jgi:hypothetical protein